MEKALKFWGTRGSCPVSGDAYHRYGGNTCCLEVRYGKSHLIIDAGTGIRPLGECLAEQEIHLLLGHTHWDHIIGLPFFPPLYNPEVHITIWSPEEHSKEMFHAIFASKRFPVEFEEIAANFYFQIAHENMDISLGELTISFHHTMHPGGALGFKITTPHQTIGYVTDNELFTGYHGTTAEIPASVLKPYEPLLAFLSDCDILIHEAQYSAKEYTKKVGWGHSSLVNTALFAEMLQVPEWFATHHDPTHTDRDLLQLQSDAEKLVRTCKVRWLADGDVLPLQ